MNVLEFSEAVFYQETRQMSYEKLIVREAAVLFMPRNHFLLAALSFVDWFRIVPSSRNWAFTI
jgi:hypothetical protein